MKADLASRPDGCEKFSIQPHSRQTTPRLASPGMADNGFHIRGPLSPLEVEKFLAILIKRSPGIYHHLYGFKYDELHSTLGP
jgi:hypothetical protein